MADDPLKTPDQIKAEQDAADADAKAEAERQAAAAKAEQTAAKDAADKARADAAAKPDVPFAGSSTFSPRPLDPQPTPFFAAAPAEDFAANRPLGRLDKLDLSPGALNRNTPDQTAAQRLRAWEDTHFGKKAVRIGGRIERGYGSPFKALLPEKAAEYAALEKLVEAETALDAANASLSAAKVAHEAALASVDAAAKNSEKAEADAKAAAAEEENSSAA